MFYKIAAVVMISSLVGCSVYPEQISVSEERNLIDFSEITQGSVGESVRWGGVITDLNKDDNVVRATVTYYPLLVSGQPTYATGSGGRFVATFSDPTMLNKVEPGTVLTLVGTVVNYQNPYPDLVSTRLATVLAEDLYIWEGLSRADHPASTLDNDHPAFIERGKWGWEVKSEKEKRRERQERENERKTRY